MKRKNVFTEVVSFKEKSDAYLVDILKKRDCEKTEARHDDQGATGTSTSPVP
jgi:hypothetical protein